MSLPYEYKIAINNTRIFLQQLLYPQITKDIPKKTRQMAGRLLKHYPAPYKVDQIFKSYFDTTDECPKYFLDRYYELAPEYHTLNAAVFTQLDKKIFKKKRKKS